MRSKSDRLCHEVNEGAGSWGELAGGGPYQRHLGAANRTIGKDMPQFADGDQRIDREGRQASDPLARPGEVKERFDGAGAHRNGQIGNVRLQRPGMKRLTADEALPEAGMLDEIGGT